MARSSQTEARDRAFAEYYAARSDTIRRTAFLLCGNWHHAEDLTQAAFIRLYTSWERINRRDTLDRYVQKIVLRLFLDDKRSAWWRRVFTADRTPDCQAPPQSGVDRLMLLEALAKVPPRQRAVLVFRYWEDLSIDETAKLLGCSPGTVKSQAQRGLILLKNMLGDSVRIHCP